MKTHKANIHRHARQPTASIEPTAAVERGGGGGIITAQYKRAAVALLICKKKSRNRGRTLLS